MPSRDDPETVADNWRNYLLTGEVPPDNFIEKLLGYKKLRRLLQRVPSDPRCKACRTPFRGFGGKVMNMIGKRPSRLNPQFCNTCDAYVTRNVGGAEVELTMLFADVRGSTKLAEQMSPGEYSKLINRFYRVVADELIKADALIEKLIGDEVAAMFVPGLAGKNHYRRALEAGRSILRATGHTGRGEPWVPVGVGVHSGMAYVGAVGNKDGVSDIVALGDAVNTAARLAAAAAAGEVLVSRTTLASSKLQLDGLEEKSLQLKGRSDPVDVAVIRGSQHQA